MDHKVSKDMISSGMIPSGEKTQADLGRTQYGSAPSPSSLADAYKSIYEHHQKDKDGNTIPHEGEELNEGKIPAGLQAYLDKKKGKKEDKKEVKEGYGAAIKAGLGLVKKIAASETGKSVVRGAATQFGASAVGNAMSGKQKQQKPTGGTVSASADLFDIVKGQLLDEGLTEEEIRDIMLTLTPDEILNEISAETALAASKARDVQAGKLKGPENTEKRAELRAKASQNYDRAVQKRQSGFVKNTASPQGPSRIPTSGM